jgi:hypothetical protein
MTAQPCKHRDQGPGPADSPRRTSGPPPPEDDIAAGTTSSAGWDSHGGRLDCSVDEAARLTVLSRELLYDLMWPGNLAYVKGGRRCLITRQHRYQFLGIAPKAATR